MPQHEGNVNSSGCSFYKLVAWETWVKFVFILVSCETVMYQINQQIIHRNSPEQKHVTSAVTSC